jgi:hypothetical protein
MVSSGIFGKFLTAVVYRPVVADGVGMESWQSFKRVDNQEHAL